VERGLTTQESGSTLNIWWLTKGQRARYRKLVARLTEQIRENPCDIDISKMLATVPPSVAANEWLKRKLAHRLLCEQSQAMRLLSNA